MGIMNGVPASVTKIPGGQIIMTSIDWALNSARRNSLWTLTFATKCCGIEMMHTGGPKYDWARFGMEVPAASPRRADLMIVAGTIVKKMVPVTRRLYEQMAEPKYVIAMGVCSISGGPFVYDSYSVLRGVDEILPVDVYIPGCPPRPEALFDGILKLHEKIKKQSIVREK